MPMCYPPPPTDGFFVCGLGARRVLRASRIRRRSRRAGGRRADRATARRAAIATHSWRAASASGRRCSRCRSGCGARTTSISSAPLTFPDRFQHCFWRPRAGRRARDRRLSTLVHGVRRVPRPRPRRRRRDRHDRAGVLRPRLRPGAAVLPRESLAAAAWLSPPARRERARQARRAPHRDRLGSHARATASASTATCASTCAAASRSGSSRRAWRPTRCSATLTADLHALDDGSPGPVATGIVRGRRLLPRAARLRQAGPPGAPAGLLDALPHRRSRHRPARSGRPAVRGRRRSRALSRLAPQAGLLAAGRACSGRSSRSARAPRYLPDGAAPARSAARRDHRRPHSRRAARPAHAARAPRFEEAADVAASEGPDVYDQDEEAAVTEQLRQLGYVE